MNDSMNEVVIGAPGVYGFQQS